MILHSLILRNWTAKCAGKSTTISVSLIRRLIGSPKNSWRKCELTAILASEIYKPGNLGWPRCKVFKATGRGPKERRCQWFEIYRAPDNPILSSGWKFSNYDIFEVPEEFFAFAYDFLPKQSKTD